MRKRRYSTDLELTPLIDVLFMLIVFFVLTTSFVASSIPVDLPEGGGSPVGGEPFVVNITRDGNVFLGGVKMTAKEAAESLAAKSENRTVLIKADRQSEYGKVVAVLDALSAAGLTRLDLAVEDVSIR